jgi:hypothetical protein
MESVGLCAYQKVLGRQPWRGFSEAKSLTSKCDHSLGLQTQKNILHSIWRYQTRLIRHDCRSPRHHLLIHIHENHHPLVEARKVVQYLGFENSRDVSIRNPISIGLYRIPHHFNHTKAFPFIAHLPLVLLESQIAFIWFSMVSQ